MFLICLCSHELLSKIGHLHMNLAVGLCLKQRIVRRSLWRRKLCQPTRMTKKSQQESPQSQGFVERHALNPSGQELLRTRTRHARSLWKERPEWSRAKVFLLCTSPHYLEHELILVLDVIPLLIHHFAEHVDRIATHLHQHGLKKHVDHIIRYVSE